MSDIVKNSNIPKLTIASPCIRNCCLNEDDNCLGCFRSLAEITQWSAATDAQRHEILDKCEKRRKAYDIKWHRHF